MLFTTLLMSAAALMASPLAAAEPEAAVPTKISIPAHAVSTVTPVYKPHSEFEGWLNATYGSWDKYEGHNYTHGYDHADGRLKKRQPARGVYYCLDTLWRGKCWHGLVTPYPRNACWRFPAEGRNSMSCFGPDIGVSCRMWQKYSCFEGGPWRQVNFPGIADLNTVGWNDK
ncbi:hypothetical protein LTS18_006878, partial [Coniosporium uncinatum]